MAEPEEVIIEGAHAATEFAARLWRRHRPGPPRVELAEVRPRLELLVAAIFGDSPQIVAAEPAALPSFVGRLARRIPRHLLDERAHASTDGVRIRLPRSLAVPPMETGEPAGPHTTVAMYRLLALEQAARAARGAPTALLNALADAQSRGVPAGLIPAVRDCFHICEAAAVDRWLAAELPGMTDALRAARRQALAERPVLSLFTPRERPIELLLRALLETPPGTPAIGTPEGKSARESAEWAIARAEALAPLPGRYRGLPAVVLWGRAEPLVPDAPVRGHRHDAPDREPQLSQERVHKLRRRPRIRPSPDDEDDGRPGMWMIQLDDPQEHAEDPMGLQRPADQDAEKDADELADSLAELPEARLVTAPGSPAEVLASDDPPQRTPLQPEAVPQRVGIAYPEWDHRIAAYLPAHAIVRELPVQRGDARWLESVLRRHAREVEQVRRRFERLRSQRVRLGRQLDGDDVDIEAYTTAHADIRAGRGSEDRLYAHVRPARRDIATTLLVDVSGSTDGWLSEQRRIIDVEKEALLLVCEALDALGDRYAVSAFSGEGPKGVALFPVKRFDERYGAQVRLRIAGLEHDRYTRMGAALRHATAHLCRETSRHRLLLLLTDGKPNDVDVYEGRYGVEDTRQAVVEARLQGVQPFCLTVDREAPSYLPRVFGPGSFAVLRRAHTLPEALVEVVRRLLEE